MAQIGGGTDQDKVWEMTINTDNNAFISGAFYGMVRPLL
jgi:hypothetical protein